MSFLLDGFSCCLGFSLPRLRFYPRFPAPGKCQLALCRVKLFLRDDTFKRMRDHDPLRRVASSGEVRPSQVFVLRLTGDQFSGVLFVAENTIDFIAIPLSFLPCRIPVLPPGT